MVGSPDTHLCLASIRLDGLVKYFHRVTVAAVMVLSALCVAGAADAASPSAQKVCVNRATGVLRYLRKTGK